MSRPSIPDLTAELRRALALRTAFWNLQLGVIGIDKATADRLLVGSLPVHTRSGFFRPAHENDATATMMFVLPTNLRDGQQVIDLLATDGDRVWRRLGTDSFLGDGEPVQASVGKWLQAGGRGSVYLERDAVWLGVPTTGPSMLERPAP